MPVAHDQQEISAWLRLALEPGVGPAAARQLLAAFGPPQELYGLPRDVLAARLTGALADQISAGPTAQLQQAIGRALDWAAQDDHHLLTLADAAYPPALLETHDPPTLLYVIGDPALLSRPAIAIVGARNATPEGLSNARAFARHLARQGWAIVSGLALGVDAAAHEGALEAGPEGGSTVAVIGTGADLIYPARNRELARRIATAGAIMTELPLGTPALSHHFPRRNRLVAGLTRGTVVAEAAARSGSLITARLAGEIGREVFAIPGSIHSPMSRGCHALIRQGAKLVETAQDILDELSGMEPGRLGTPLRRSSRPAGPAAQEEDPILAAMGHGPVHLDDLAQRAGCDVETLQARLLELEFAGRIDRLPGSRVQIRHA